MWTKLTEQIPALIVTILAIAAGAYWLHSRTVADMTARQEVELAALRLQTNAEVKAAAEATRRQIEAINTLLKDAISKRAADVFMTDEEVAKLNAEKVDQLAEAIALRIQPHNPLPRTPEEAERQQDQQVDRVSSRLAGNIQPILAEMAADQSLTRESLIAYSQRISDQVSTVLANELNRNQQLNNNLAETQAVAQDSLALSHELTALYLSSFKDQGMLTRILSLPANVIRDATQLSIVNSTERRQKEEELVSRLGAIQERLQAIHSVAPSQATPVAEATTPSPSGG